MRGLNSSEGSNPSLSATVTTAGGQVLERGLGELVGYMFTRSRLGIAHIFPVLVLPLVLVGCSQTEQRLRAEAPAYINRVTEDGYSYSHNWEGSPCFTANLQGSDWVFEESLAERVRWSRGDIVLSIYFSDNRTQRFAAAGMGSEDILRAFLAYELEYIRPNFDFQLTKPPKFASVEDSLWMQWGGTGTGGKRQRTEPQAPADQRHVIISLWIDPFVMSFDWASADLKALEGPTLEMIETLENLEFHPECFSAMGPPAQAH